MPNRHVFRVKWGFPVLKNILSSLLVERWAMAADEILMGQNSALGPIDAQIERQGKRFSAGAFVDGLNKIVDDANKNK